MLPNKLLVTIVCLFFGAHLSSPGHASESGLKPGEHVNLVQAHCLGCHSAKLVTQNHMNRDDWLQTIRYMQKNHNLWPLGEHEDLVLDYLATHYGVSDAKRPRRANLPYK